MAETSIADKKLLLVKDLVKTFVLKAGMIEKKHSVRAVDGVSFSMSPSETLGLVGESGCGKSTLSRMIINLLQPDSGRVIFQGREITSARGRNRIEARSGMQLIFQNPYLSLNPRMNAKEIIAEALILQKKGSAAGKPDRALLGQEIERIRTLVGLSRDCLSRYPDEFSGGQRQRIAIGRAIGARPKLIICDEPLSSLDLPAQAEILKLLNNLQQELKLSYLFITHDLRLVRKFAQRIAVMQKGKLVEIAQTEEIFARPNHPYTKLLLNHQSQVKD